MSNLALRVLTALLVAPVVAGAVWRGGWVFGALVALAAVAAQAEVYRFFQTAGARPLVGPGLALGALAALAALVPAPAALLGLGALVVLGLTLARPSEAPLLDASATLFGALYPAGLAGAALFLRTSEAPWLAAGGAAAPFWLTLAVVVGVWGADTLAYFAGRAFGRRKLAPRVSPNKTWEGALGGALGALGVVAAFKVWALDAALSWPDVLVLGLACGVGGPLGDLVESLFKRSVGAKDSGTLVPGHGGVLDRIDALLFALPLAAIYLALTRGL